MRTGRKILVVFAIFSLLLMLNLPKALAANAKYDAAGLPDMSDFDPSNPIIPTGGTIKIAIVASFSGPAAIVGEIYFISVQWAAHDINKRGGILVDGKRKKIQVIRADTQSKPAVAKKVCERMILKEHVNVLWGTNGSHIMKVINQVAKKYGVIAQCAAALSDELYDARNFTRYSFMTSFQTKGRQPTTTVRSGRRKRSFTSSARTISSATPWPKASRRDSSSITRRPSWWGKTTTSSFSRTLPRI
ncbi:MAG: ABC transporter substrate-binding protein [Deltaproteobacteria bacterium]|nr:ABC transporter substrate-binding protein [Deltaproteobacteria bacterium]